MINVGIAGIGFMGMIHYLSYQKLSDAKVVAFCEKDSQRLSGDWTGIQGNFGPRGEQMDMSPFATYEEFDELIANPDVDLIDICLPPAWHADMAVKALEAGKHVFCEKPIALKPADADRMVEAAAANNRLLMIGHVLPFFPEYRFAYDAITGGEYGKLLGGTFKRIIDDPKWLKDFWNADKVGGPMLDLHVHDAHFIRLVFGMPTAVTTTGSMRDELAELFTSQFQFEDENLSAVAASGAIAQHGRSFTHGYEIYLERATIMFYFAVIGGEAQALLPLTVLGEGDSVTRPELGSGDPLDAFAAELREVVASVAEGKESPLLGGQLARDAVVLCQKQTESLAHRKTVAI